MVTSLKPSSKEMAGIPSRELGVRECFSLIILVARSQSQMQVFSPRAVWVLCTLTIQRSSLRKSVFGCIHHHPCQRGDAPGEVPGSTGTSSMQAYCTGAFPHIRAILCRGLLRQTLGLLTYFWLNTVGCHNHLHACRFISASKHNQPIASLSPIIPHAVYQRLCLKKWVFFCPGCNRRQI